MRDRMLKALEQSGADYADISGKFSNNVSMGFLVRNGEAVGRVKNAMIAGNAYELLKDNLIGLSDRPEWVFGFLSTPAIAVDGVGVTSQG